MTMNEQFYLQVHYVMYTAFRTQMGSKMTLTGKKRKIKAKPKENLRQNGLYHHQINDRSTRKHIRDLLQAEVQNKNQ